MTETKLYFFFQMLGLMDVFHFSQVISTGASFTLTHGITGLHGTRYTEVCHRRSFICLITQRSKPFAIGIVRRLVYISIDPTV